MKTTILHLLLFSVLGAGSAGASQSAPASEEPAAAVDIHSCPCPITNYLEISNAREDLRKSYLETLSSQIKKLRTSAQTVTSFEKVSVAELENLWEGEAEWEGLMTKVYRACQNPLNKGTCSKMEDDRMDLLERGSARGPSKKGKKDAGNR